MTDLVRAILIDPRQRTVAEVQIERDDYRAVRQILRCEHYTSAAHLGGSIEQGFDAVDASDDPLEDRAEDDLRFWFQVDADRDPPSSFPVTGLGLAQGVDPEGNACDVSISVAELAARITFTERRFKGFKVRTFKGGVEISPVAPIVDKG